MQLTRLDHIGIAVEDLDAGIANYTRLLGAAPGKVETVASEAVRAAFFAVGDTRIELLAATDPSSAVAKFIAKRGPGIHHLCFAVPDLDRALSDLAAEGVAPLTTGDRYGAGGHRVAFFHPKQTGGALIELVEVK